MGAAALAIPNTLSLVTIADRALPAWCNPIGAAHVPYRAGSRTERNLLGAKLDEAVTQADRAVLLIAQGAGCFATAWWARLSPASYVSRVAGALFVEPDAREGDVESLLDTFASPRTTLPFPSIVVQGREAPQLGAIAADWGSRVVTDVSADTTFRRTLRVIERFTASVVEREVRAAQTLLGQGIDWRR
jgi:uncharacterized protein